MPETPMAGDAEQPGEATGDADQPAGGARDADPPARTAGLADVEEPTSRDAPIEAERPDTVRVGVPVALGVLTWTVLALAVGVLLSGLSLSTVLALVLLVVLAWPIYQLRPWDAGATDRTLARIARNRRALAVGIGLFALARLPVAADILSPVFGLLLLPLRAVPSLLKGGTVVYGEALGGVVFDLGRWYAELLWLTVVGAGVAKLFPRDEP